MLYCILSNCHRFHISKAHHLFNKKIPSTPTTSSPNVRRVLDQSRDLTFLPPILFHSLPNAPCVGVSVGWLISPRGYPKFLTSSVMSSWRGQNLDRSPPLAKVSQWMRLTRSTTACATASSDVCLANSVAIMAAISWAEKEKKKNPKQKSGDFFSLGMLKCFGLFSQKLLPQAFTVLWNFMALVL